MKKPKIKKLQYPLWFHIIFYIMTIIVPLVLIMVEGYQSESTTFKISFGMITALVILWSFIKKFIIGDIETKMRARKTQLEHDYEIEIGNSEKIKWLWFVQEEKITIFDTITMVLYGGLFLLILNAIASSLMAIKGAAMAIALTYVVAYILKFAVILAMKGADEPTDEPKV